MARDRQAMAAVLARAAELKDETARDLSEIVRIPSLSGGEGAVIDKIAGTLEGYGVEDVRVDGLGNLIARVGEGERSIAFDAHIDTVDTGDLSQWTGDPFSGMIGGGYVYGRGSVDQKGGAASMMTAARILAERGGSPGTSVYFTFTVMEEDCDGLCWDYLIEEEGFRPDFVCITEPTSLGVYRGQRGRMEFEISFTGVSAHGSAPERGSNAIYMAARTCLGIDALGAELASDPFLGRGSITVTRMNSSAPSLCAVPDGASIHVDRRLTWGETAESAGNELRALADGLALTPAVSIEVPRYEVPSYRGTVYPREQYFPPWKIETGHPLYRAGLAAAAAAGVDDSGIGRWTFSTNGVSICGRHGIPCIGFGPGDEPMAHAPNERVPIGHLEKAAMFYALLPSMIAKQQEESE